MKPPEPFNIAETICRRHQDAVYRIALQDVKFAGINTYTFGGLDYLSDKFATILYQCGIKQNDVIATVLPQGAAFVVAHLAILKAGATVLPISIKTAQTEIENLLTVSGAKMVVVDETIYPYFNGLAKRVVQVEQIFVACDYTSRNDFGEGFRSFWYEVNFADADFTIAPTDKTTPAYLFCQRENDGWQKHLLSHGELAESCANFSQNPADPKAVFWTANDWSSKRVLSEMLYPAWYEGYAVAAYEMIGKNVEESLSYLDEMGLASVAVYGET